MTHISTPNWKARVLRAAAELDGTDIYKTAGKSPVWSAAAMSIFGPLIEDGLLRLDESECPISPNSRTMGFGFVVLTDAGRAFIKAHPIAEKAAV